MLLEYTPTGRALCACDRCGTRFALSPCFIKRGQGKFCSRTCRDDARRLDERRCAGCGKAFQPQVSVQRFCSRPCGHASQRIDPATALWSRVDCTTTPEGCWPFTGRTFGFGYGQLKVARVAWVAHRLAFTLTYGAIPEGLLVLHSCDNPPCCRPDHLWLGNEHVNSADMVLKGRSLAGERNPMRRQPERAARGERVNTARLTAPQVVEIRARHAAGWTQLALAAHYNVSQQNIFRIVRRETWKHVTP